MRFLLRSASRRWSCLIQVGVCAWLGTPEGWCQPGGGTPEIQSFHQFYLITPEQARQSTPVRIKGVVLCYDPGWNQLYIHDGAETAWLSPQQFQSDLQVGLNVELTGFTAFGSGGASFTNLQLRVLGHGALPAAKRLDIVGMGTDFGQWIETQGYVRLVDTSLGRLGLVLEDKGKSCLVYVMTPPGTNDFRGLSDCIIRVRGINASKAEPGGLKAASVFVTGMNEVTVLQQPRARMSEVPVTSIDALLNRELGYWTNNIVHLNGVITSYEPGSSLLLKDATGSLRARVIQSTQAQADERVDVWGYLTVVEGETILHDAFFELHRPLAEPVPLSGGEPASQPLTNRAEIRQISEVSELGPEAAAVGLPVRLQGIVTYADPDWHNCFVQDQRGAIYVDLSQRDVAAGQWVEVTGRTSRGGFAPEVINSTIRILASTNLPTPVKVDLEDLANGHLDARWVQLEGVVRRVTEQWGHVTLLITSPKGRFKAILPGFTDQPAPSHLVDALVSVQGACISEMNTRGQLVGISLHVPSLEYISVLEAVPADPFKARATPISSVSTFDPTRLSGRRVKVGGVVTLVLPGQGCYVQDASGGILIGSLQTNELHVGDAVNILGFPRIGDFSPSLEEAVFQRTGSAGLPAPRRTTAEKILLQGTNDAALVRLEAQLLQRAPRSAHPRLVLQSGPVVFTATLEKSPSSRENLDFEVGSLLRLTGVCSIQGGEGHEPETFRLLVAGPADVVLVSAPPWWTMRHTLMLFGGLGLGALLAWAWGGTLRRQVRLQTEQIRRNEEELIRVSRQAGMAEVATAVLHNVGNVLNSVNVSAGVATDELRKSKNANVSKVAALLQEHADDLGHFFTHDPKGSRLPDYLARLGAHLEAENTVVLNELKSLTDNIQHINDIVAVQQSYARVGGVIEKITATELVEDALRMNLGALERHQVRVIREYGHASALGLTVEKHKALQILVNLLSNAKYACSESGQPEKRITLRITNETDLIRISCTDNGVGIPTENLVRIFNHGFTTRKTGHGFGLHSAALAAQQLGGALRVQSAGPGCGATFTLELPQAGTAP